MGIRHHPQAIDNTRFLIVPWIRMGNLGCHAFSVIRRRLTADWTLYYDTTPVLIETSVETRWFAGGLYEASGWTCLGLTHGCGRYDRSTHPATCRDARKNR